jgi:TolA-binding protein
MASINIQFRLPESYAGEIADYAVRGESQSQTVRRLLLDLLDGVKDSAPEPSSLDSLGDRLSALEKRMARMEDFGIESRRGSFDNGDRLSALENRLSALEGDKQETAIMIQKRHSPAPVIPEITYSHEQAATEWQRTTATVKRWASKPEKWPQGWLFDADKQFWVRTA